MPFVQRPCDEQEGRWRKLERAHSGDFRCQPGTIQGDCWDGKDRGEKNWVQPSVQSTCCFLSCLFFAVGKTCTPKQKNEFGSPVELSWSCCTFWQTPACQQICSRISIFSLSAFKFLNRCPPYESHKLAHVTCGVTQTWTITQTQSWTGLSWRGLRSYSRDTRVNFSYFTIKSIKFRIKPKRQYWEPIAESFWLQTPNKC